MKYWMCLNRFECIYNKFSSFHHKQFRTKEFDTGISTLFDAKSQKLFIFQTESAIIISQSVAMFIWICRKCSKFSDTQKPLQIINLQKRKHTKYWHIARWRPECPSVFFFYQTDKQFNGCKSPDSSPSIKQHYGSHGKKIIIFVFQWKFIKFKIRMT